MGTGRAGRLRTQSAEGAAARGVPKSWLSAPHAAAEKAESGVPKPHASTASRHVESEGSATAGAQSSTGTVSAAAKIANSALSKRSSTTSGGASPELCGPKRATMDTPQSTSTVQPTSVGERSSRSVSTPVAARSRLKMIVSPEKGAASESGISESAETVHGTAPIMQPKPSIHRHRLNKGRSCSQSCDAFMATRPHAEIRQERDTMKMPRSTSPVDAAAEAATAAGGAPHGSSSVHGMSGTFWRARANCAAAVRVSTDAIRTARASSDELDARGGRRTLAAKRRARDVSSWRQLTPF